MKSYDGQYEAQLHIAQELLKFPDTDITKVKIQQFIGIVNYLRDFVPHLSTFISLLNKMLRKDPPQWTQDQTEAVKKLKKIMQSLPPLQIPSDEKRILQTNASDKHWSIVLLEEDKDEK